MPPRPFSSDLLPRTSYICQSCLLRIRGQQQQRKPWLLRNYSVTTATQQAAKRSADPEAKANGRSRKPRARAPPKKEDDQAVALEVPPSDLSRPEINYFNEERPGQYRQLRDVDEFNRVAGGLDAESEASIKELDEQMGIVKSLIDELQKQGMGRQARQLASAYKSRLKSGLHTRAEVPHRDYDELKIVPGESSTQQQRQRIWELNKFFRQITVDDKGVFKPGQITECWKLYSGARSGLKTSGTVIPPKTWNLLWMMLSWDVPQNPNRMHRLYLLSKDISAVGVPLSPQQHLLALEAMFLEGFEDEAISNWKKAVTVLGSDPAMSQDYWELGVRMCSLKGDFERAQLAIDKLLSSGPDANPRILVTYIRALSRSEATLEKAWQSYRQLRELLGDSMTIEDYDEVIGAFLSTGCVEYGLHAFVDMMFSGAINLHGRSTLPPSVANKFFIGKWLKRLIGAGDLEGAYSVIRYMQEKTILLDAIQLNGLIGAWLRSETEEYLEKAERLAWSMIRSRLVFVQLRERELELDWPLKLRDVGWTAKNSKYDDEADQGLRFVPKATLETFSLMAENYQRRRLPGHLAKLWMAFKQADLGPNTFLLNQLMLSHVQEEQPGEALAVYRDVMSQMHVRPDSHTFRILYQLLAINRLYVASPEQMQRDVVMARQYFYDMVVAPHDVRDVREAMTAPPPDDRLPRDILFSFHRLRDYAALLTAARAMHALYGYVPSEQLLVELAVAAGSASGRRGGAVVGRTQRQARQARVVSAAQAVARLLDRRRVALEKAEGRTLDDLDAHERGAQLLNVLEELVRDLAARKNGGVDSLTPSALEKAAREMGVLEAVAVRAKGEPQLGGGSAVAALEEGDAPEGKKGKVSK